MARVIEVEVKFNIWPEGWLDHMIELEGASVPLQSFEQRVTEPDRFTEFYRQECLTQKLLPASTGDASANVS